MMLNAYAQTQVVRVTVIVKHVRNIIKKQARVQAVVKPAAKKSNPI